MLKTHLLNQSTALNTVVLGANKLYEPVAATMGPRGHNVIIRKLGKRVLVTHDGVTVAKAVELNDPAEAASADIMREAALRLDAITGDGTTTVTVLAYKLLEAMARLVEEGANPMVLKLALEGLLPQVVAQIEAKTDKQITRAKLVQVATVAAGSKEIGTEIGRFIYSVGHNTPVLIGYSDDARTNIEVIKGFKIDSGPASQYLMDGVGTKVEIETPKVVVVDAKLRDKEDVLPILRMISGLDPAERKVLLVVSDISSDALKIMVVNRLKAFADIAVARVPEHIKGHTQYLQDVAIATGATVLSRNTGHSITDPHPDHMGSADRVIVSLTDTVIVGGHSIEEDLLRHLADLGALAKDTGTRKYAEDRLKTLRQQIVSVLVGGQTEAEAEERFFRYEDAVGATRAAARGGIVPGGGTLLYSIAASLPETPVAQALAEALRQPLKRVLSNAGIDYEPFHVNFNAGNGFDVLHPDDGIIDLVKRGILDPAQSELECVKTAVAVAGLLLTAGGMIIDEEIKRENQETQGSSSPN